MTLKRTALFIVFVTALLSVFPACSGKADKPNILLITLDTVRRDHLGAYGYPRDTSPFIDGLAKEGVLFKNVVTPIPVTDGSHASILTSLHPLTHNVIINADVLSSGLTTLAEVLKDAGYYTIGTVAVKHMSRKYNFSQGFDSFSDKFGDAQREAADVNKSLFAQIDEYKAKGEGKPFFIWLHYYDAHTPYTDRGYTFKEDVPEKYRKMKPAKIVDIVHRYNTEIRYVDEAVQKVNAYMKQKGMTENLVTCITADHGEQLGEHGWYSGHFDIYSENTFVPLIFHGPGAPKGKQYDEYVSTMDIGVTLLNMAGLSFPGAVEGFDLMKMDRYVKAHKKQKRDFLILGYPPYVKATQLLRYPYSYIVSYEHHYRSWRISQEDVIPAERFEKIEPQNIQVVDKKKKHRQVNIHLPYKFDPGIRYAALKVKIEEPEPRLKKFRVWVASRMRTQHNTQDPVEDFTIVHPVNPLDRMTFILRVFIKPGVKLKDVSYTVLTPEEFEQIKPRMQKLKNDMFAKIWSNRKLQESDELFDLSTDEPMDKNILEAKKNDFPVKAYIERTYKLFEDYYKKGKKRFNHRRSKKALTEKQKKMLKTLGYI